MLLTWQMEQSTAEEKKNWTSWGLNPGPSHRGISQLTYKSDVLTTAPQVLVTQLRGKFSEILDHRYASYPALIQSYSAAARSRAVVRIRAHCSSCQLISAEN